MTKELAKKEYQTFERIKQTEAFGGEYWSARQLSKILEYSEYRHFLPVIERAKEACRNSGHLIKDHFEDILDMVEIGSGAKRSIEDVKLSRYACYLIVQNGDPSKPVIANGQTYFAIQTRRQELSDDAVFQSLREEEKRLFLRDELKEHNKQLVEAAQQSGVATTLDFAIFQNHGYKGLYGGLDAQGIHQRKGLKKSQKILDHMDCRGTACRAPTDYRTHAHLFKTLCAKARQTIKELGGTMPEDLPAPDKSIGQVKREQKTLE